MTSISILRVPLALAALTISVSMTAPAAAQMYPGEGVTVNPYAIGAVPYYPGALLPPGAKSRALPPVHLYPPGQHRQEVRVPRKPRVARHKPEPVQEAASEPVPAPMPPAAMPKASAPPAPAPNPAVNEPAASEPEATANAIPFSFGEPVARGAGGPSARSPHATAAPAPARAPASASTQLTSAAPPPKVTLDKGLSKQASVLFDTGSAELSAMSSARLNDLAFSLKTALANGADHIELVAFGGKPGDKSSDARRISLKRALAVRQALIVDGVPATRIDVRALGGVTDNGPTDRVDIFVKA